MFLGMVECSFSVMKASWRPREQPSTMNFHMLIRQVVDRESGLRVGVLINVMYVIGMFYWSCGDSGILCEISGYQDIRLGSTTATCYLI